MAEIQAFRGIRYAAAGTNDVGARLAPPYDVLSEEDKQRLLARDPHNFVKIDLPHTPPKFAGPPEAYAAAKRTMDDWLDTGVLMREAQPAIYVYHQAYSWAGRNYTRKKFFARLRLEEFGKGSVYPHEQTFGGPKEDRLLLMKATAAQLSPIFGVFEDAKNEVAARLEKALPPQPLLHGKLDNTDNRLWAVNDAATIAEVTRMMASKAIYIADGHHRYGTALNYQAWLREQKCGQLPADHPANFVLCVFCAMEDAGLLILPTHRVLPGVAATPDSFRGDDQIIVKPMSERDPDRAIAAIAPSGPQALVLCTAKGEMFGIQPRDPAILDKLEPAHSTAWRRLGLAFLHAYVLDRCITPRLCGGKAPEIHYVKNAAEAVSEARSTNGCVFLMQPNTMTELRDVCSAGDLMPQKSTFFYPKLASGLVLHSLQ